MSSSLGRKTFWNGAGCGLAAGGLQQIDRQFQMFALFAASARSQHKKKEQGADTVLQRFKRLLLTGCLVYCVLSFRPFSSSCSRPGRPRRPQPTSSCLDPLHIIILSRSVVVPSLNCCGGDIHLYPLRTPSPAELLPRPNFCQLSSNCSTLYPRSGPPGIERQTLCSTCVAPTSPPRPSEQSPLFLIPAMDR